LALALCPACNDDDDSGADTDTDTDTDSDTDTDADTDTDSDTDTDTDADCFELEFDVETVDPIYIQFSTATATGDLESITGYDVRVEKVLGVGPGFFLGPDVGGIDLGSDDGFVDVVEAPESGYAEDGDDPVIGHGYTDGGSGATGFEMSGNVYVMLLADGSHAKMSVTSAVAGLITVDAFWSESEDLTCAWP